MSEQPGRFRRRLMFVAGIIVGAAVLVGLRYLFQPDQHGVHYHANWAIFVDGNRFDLTGNRYMEDVGQCSVDPTHQRPEDRVHMHEANQDIVHVHDSGATWGHLLANLGFGIGDTYLDLGPPSMETSATRSLKFVLNGAAVRSVRNLPIGDQDRLLISFGPETADEAIVRQFPSVAETAAEFNTRPDPASCSGEVTETPRERLRRAVGVR